MRRQKPEARLLCYASIIALSLSACTQHGGKLKNTNLTDNSQPASTSDDKKIRGSLVAQKSNRWLRKKGKSGSQSGKNSSPHDNLWDRLFDLYDLPPVEHQDIDRELEWFVNHPGYIDRVQKRAEPFLYSIVRRVEKYDIPGEIALLPVIESAFQPHAVSPANAAGIWQFIPSTGRLYGLKQSRSYDGRRDVYASTKAAIKYLKKLHSDFDGDWLLAIAAYNCGEGAVARAIQKNAARNLPTDFWSLDLPQETRSYVPRLLAVAKLFSDAPQYGIDLHHIPNAAVYKPVKVSTQLDLALAADAADISLDKLFELNPGFKRQFTDLNGSYRLFIPAEKTAEFKQELARLGQESQSSVLVRDPRTPEAHPDDSGVMKVASAGFDPTHMAEPVSYSRQGISPVSFQRERRESIREKELPVERDSANSREPLSKRKGSGKDRSNRIQRAEAEESRSLYRTAEKGHGRRALEIPVAAEKVQDRSNSNKKGSYTVQAGETLWAVARRHSVDVEQLAKWNNLSKKQGIKTGQTLVVWSKDAAKKLTLANTGIRPSQSIKYTIREGDTLFSISRRFKVSVTDLRKWNGSQIEKQMQPGKNITVAMEKN